MQENQQTTQPETPKTVTLPTEQKPIKLNRAQTRKLIGESKNKRNGHAPKAEWNKEKRTANAKKRKAQRASRKRNR